MSSAEMESVNQEIARQTALLNELRLSHAEPPTLEEAKMKLGELKKWFAALKSAAGGKDAGKKRERLLLKTAKVRTVPSQSDAYKLKWFYFLGHA
jgi:histidyl-tRNA synthetase